jgi:hypothetical protein
MQVVVVGGHTRNIGKTSVMSALIREFATLGWTAVKITQYGHGVCSHDGHACECAPREHPFAVTEERDPATGSDTSRYLAAGARQSLWLRVREGQLGAAVPLLTRRLDCAPSVIIESNSIMEFIDPLLYLVVLDPSRADFKASAGRWIRRAHALVPVENRTASTDEARNGSSAVSGVQLGVRLGAEWGVKVGPDFGAGIEAEFFRSKPSFPVRPPEYSSLALTAFVRERLASPPDARAAAGFPPPRAKRRSLVEETLPR